MGEIQCLFISHRFGWMDMRDEVAWGYEHEHADEQGGSLVIGERIQVPVLDDASLNIRVKTWY